MKWLLTFGLILLLPGVSSCDLLYSNGAPDQADGENITSLVAADDFVISASKQIDSLSIWASADQGNITSSLLQAMNWKIYQDQNGMPGMQLSAGTDSIPTISDTGLQISGSDEYRIDINVPFGPLSAGRYWFAVTASVSDPTTTLFWDTTSNSSGSPAMSANSFSDLNWSPGLFATTSTDLAFEIYGGPVSTTPTPEIYMFMPCFGFCLVIMSRSENVRSFLRSRKRKPHIS